MAIDPSKDVIRIATWNLERPKLQGWARRSRIEKKMRGINADLWILTETNAVISPGKYFFSAATLPEANYHTLGESSATIWTHWRMLQNIETYSADTAVCVELESPLGPMIVYASIITYANDKGPSGASKRWVEHRKAIAKHAADWKRIRKEFPNHHFVAGGDYNQSRDGSGWYEDKESLLLLTNALQESSLTCVTEMKFTELLSRSNIDHICISGGLEAKTSAWEGTENGNRMSDHNGVLVEIRSK